MLYRTGIYPAAKQDTYDPNSSISFWFLVTMTVAGMGTAHATPTMQRNTNGFISSSLRFRSQCLCVATKLLSYRTLGWQQGNFHLDQHQSGGSAR